MLKSWEQKSKFEFVFGQLGVAPDSHDQNGQIVAASVGRNSALFLLSGINLPKIFRQKLIQFFLFLDN